MGVHGLWKLIEPSGKPVPLESLENKVLAIDVSIWLHQLVKGFQDSKGAPLANAHLLGIYHRICKLLYFRIKPVFVFDGGVPVLKRQTMAKRNEQKSKNLSEAERIHKNLLATLLKHSAVSKVLSEKAKAAITASLPAASSPKKSKKQEDDLYVLPPNESIDSTLSSSCDDDSSTDNSDHIRQYDLHSIDTNSIQFKSLPADVRHEILTDLKETRKQSSWGRIHEMPTQSDDFASYQMKRLLKRQSVQNALEEVEKEMGGHTLSLGELEKILKDQGVITTGNMKGSKIASDENTRFLLIKDIKETFENAKKQNEIEESIEEGEKSEHKDDRTEEDNDDAKTARNKGDIEYEEELRKAIALSLEDAPSTSKDVKEKTSEIVASSSKDVKEKTPEIIKVIGGKGRKRIPLSFLEGFNDEDFFDSESSEDELTPTKLTPAQRYMMEYSGLTAYEIAKIIASKRESTKKNSKEEEKKINNEKYFDLNGDKNVEKPSEEVADNVDAVCILDVNEYGQLDKSGKEIIYKNSGSAETEDKLEEDTLKIGKEPKENYVSAEKIYLKSDKEIELKGKVTTGELMKDSENKHKMQENHADQQVQEIEEEDTELEIIPNSGLSNDEFLEIDESNKKEVTEEVTIGKLMKDAENKCKMQENQTNEQVQKVEEEEDAEVETISDSESSNDDFLEIDENYKEKNNITSMEVTIKPNEEMEDDLFKDVFTNENTEKSIAVNEKKLSENEFVEIVTENSDLSIPEEINELQTTVKEGHVEEMLPEKELIPNLKDKITKMIEDYSKTKDYKNTEQSKLSVEQMKEMKENLSKKQEELLAERSTKERLAGNITDQMYQEAQELLELFGVPYLIAPMEAEAQCAFLELVDLTNGTITDDSDIWLFGGKTVYKNFFNQSKTVLEFKCDNIQQYFKMTREQMVLLAMLVGSDYTVGLKGVGPVTALEILAAFPSKNELLSGLMEFRSWFDKGKLPTGPGRTALRSKLKNVTFTENFPNPHIVKAYLEPQVDNSNELFTWAKPDVVGLVDFAKQKFGWTKHKSEEILNPILKRLEDRKKQKVITNYFKTEFKTDSGETESKLSKRVKSAITKIGKHGINSDEEEPKIKKSRADKNNGVKIRSKSKVKKTPKNFSKEKADEDIEILKQTQLKSEKKLGEIHEEIQKKMEEQDKRKKMKSLNLHKKEVIPQKQKDKTEMLKNKLKAIETFRKSKQGPGYVKKRAKLVRAAKEDASYLSESSDSD